MAVYVSLNGVKRQIWEKYFKSKEEYCSFKFIDLRIEN